MDAGSFHNLETLHKHNEFNENHEYLEKIGGNDHRAELMEKAGSHDKKGWIQSEDTSLEDRSWNKDYEIVKRLSESVTTEGTIDSTAAPPGEAVEVRDHIHGEPDWKHTHDWIDHGAVVKTSVVPEPVIEDDNVFEAMQDYGDDVRHYDDQLNKIEYPHKSVYHSPSVIIGDETKISG